MCLFHTSVATLNLIIMTMTTTELTIIDLYKAIEKAETRKEVKHLIKRIEALRKAQRLND